MDISKMMQSGLSRHLCVDTKNILRIIKDHSLDVSNKLCILAVEYMPRDFRSMNALDEVLLSFELCSRMEVFIKGKCPFLALNYSKH